MKQINNKQTSIEIIDDEKKGKANYCDLIRIALRQQKQGGYSYDDIKNRIAVDKALREADKLKGKQSIIELEDSYHTFLLQLIKDANWSFWHEDLLQFIDDIISNNKN